MKDFIAYSVKNGIKYATLCHPVQDADGKWVKTYSNLGRVLNEEAGTTRVESAASFLLTWKPMSMGGARGCRVDSANTAAASTSKQAA